MFTIIGGDGKEYGSVTAEDLRRWIAEGRLNGQSLVKAEGDAEFRALSAFPEFADAFAPQAPMPAAPTISATTTSLAEGDYELDIGGCISRGWNLFKENFGILFVASLIMFALQIAISGALNLITMPVAKNLITMPVGFRIGFTHLLSAVVALGMGPLLGGLYFVYLKTIRRQSAVAGDVFAGFRLAFLQLFLGTLVVSLITSACLLPFEFVWTAKTGALVAQLQSGQQMSPADAQKILPEFLSAFTASLPMLLIGLIPMTYLMVCLQFTLPLIIDQGLDFWPAMKTSFKRVNRHWLHVFGLTVLVGLVTLAGFLGCCIGVLFTAPIGIAAMMFAYETIFTRPHSG
jgi:hypothetical protein